MTTHLQLTLIMASDFLVEYSYTCICVMLYTPTASHPQDHTLWCHPHLLQRPGWEHAWTKCGIWESHSREILLLEGNICNLEGKYIV